MVFAAMLAAGVALHGQSTTPADAIPDSPRPQTLPQAADVTPGKGASSSGAPQAGDANTPGAPTSSLPASSAPTPAAADDVQKTAPEIAPELGPGGRVATIRTQVNFVQVPFTVKDKKGQLVPGVDWREVQVFENGVRKRISFWSSDPFPLSVAFVIDQSLDFKTMDRVNSALGAVQGAFTPYDEMAIITYNNGASLRTDFTRADGPRIPAVINQYKTSGREIVLADPQGPLSQTNSINNHNFDVNTAPNRSNPNAVFQTEEKQVHALNDAIFFAAQQLAKAKDNRRRILYVISDGKEYGSKVKQKEVIRYLQAHNISVYATVVGDSSTPLVGFLDRYHIPFQMKDNILPQYCAATGGEAVSEVRIKGIEDSFAKIATDVRAKYTVGYYSNEAVLDGKFRTLEVKVLRPGLDVIAPPGYYPAPRLVNSGAPAKAPATN